ncbi:MAG TPA: hypothetical protein PKH16_09855 [Aequorivita sp.]|nr:hypothetical protein [Aequorivita sp.]
MKIKPILFSTPMVQAILDGRKKQTRRILKASDNLSFVTIQTYRRIWDSKVEANPNPVRTLALFKNADAIPLTFKSKYQKGDILWVRETFIKIFVDNEFEGSREEFAYKASFDEAEKKYGMIKNPAGKRFIDSWKWKPSIFMPKEACRIFLEVTDVRVERLQDISNEDALKEGISNHYLLKSNGYTHYTRPDKFIPIGSEDAERTSFFSLWMSINGADSLDKNPWVWVYEFKQVEKPKNFLK